MESYQYWMLDEYAFRENADSKYFYKSLQHQEALDRLNYVVESKNMGMGLLTGEIGSGKTMTRNVFIDILKDNEIDYEYAVMETSDFSFVDIFTDVIGQLCHYSTSDLPATKYKLYNILKGHIKTKIIPFGKKIIILLDEAQKISKPVLDALKDLTNIVYDNISVITIILIGQPELQDKLKDLPQVDQRISLKYHIDYMNLDDTKEYIKYRLFTAHSSTHSNKEIFTENAIKLIYYQTHGIPREINRVCRIALDYGFAEELEKITDKEMKIILNEFK